MECKEKTTVPVPSVGADGEQPIFKNTTGIIATDPGEINPQFSEIEDDFAEIQRRIERMNDPSYLNAITMTELFNTVYQDAEPIVDKLLYPGLYIFAGAPKKGKSFAMLQIAYQICTGAPLWECEVQKGPCLYLALEDRFSRLQHRLYRRLLIIINTGRPCIVIVFGHFYIRTIPRLKIFKFLILHTCLRYN